MSLAEVDTSNAARHTGGEFVWRQRQHCDEVEEPSVGGGGGVDGDVDGGVGGGASDDDEADTGDEERW